MKFQGVRRVINMDVKVIDDSREGKSGVGEKKGELQGRR